MSGSRYANTVSSIQRKLKEGRGLGRGKDYKPWLMVHDVPSRGRSSNCTIEGQCPS